MQRPPAAWSGGCLLEWKLYGSVGAGSKFIKILVHAHIFLLTFQVIGIDLPCSRKKRQTRIYIYINTYYIIIYIYTSGGFDGAVAIHLGPHRSASRVPWVGLITWQRKKATRSNQSSFFDLYSKEFSIGRLNFCGGCLSRGSIAKIPLYLDLFCLWICHLQS